jgi:OmpA-OmpF porin, OOP family
MMLRYCAVVFALIFGFEVFAQSKADNIRFGDEAFSKGNYASAAFFYHKALTGFSVVIHETVYPYDLKHSNRDFSKKKNKKAEIDSSAVDSTMVVPIMEVTKDSTGQTTITLTEKQIEKGTLTHKLAESYRLDYNYLQAETYFEQAVNYKNSEFPLARYRYGEVLMNNEKYEQANEQFSEFIYESSENQELEFYLSFAKEKMRSCSFALKNFKDKTTVNVFELDSVVNSFFSVFAVNYGHEENDFILSASKLIDSEDAMDHIFDINLYSLSKDNEKWSSPKAFPNPLNSTTENQAAGVFNSEGNRMYFTSWNGSECSIYLCNKLGDMWAKPMKLNQSVNAEGYRSMHPALSADGKTLYFSSDRPDGKGGLDLWSCSLDRWGNATGEPVNLSQFNTPLDEVSPFVHHESGDMYFSSNGLYGFGGFDIFHSDYIEEQGWMKPSNMGKPINSSKDDTYFILSKDVKTGFFSSDRIDCTECTHGNCLKVFAYEQGPPVFFLDGYVFNADNGDVIPNAKIIIKDVKEDVVIYELETDEEGYYSTPVEVGMIYFIKGQKIRFFSDATSLSTEGLVVSESFMRDLYLTPISDDPVDIPGIEYDYDKATLRPISMEILDKLYDFLVLNDNLIVELQSHTDSRGSDEYNLRLSQERAQSCVDYLVGKGIAPERLVPVGYGEHKPKIPDAQTEEEHQKNRRTAFLIISQDYE